ncbi:hypothetical protein, partial [Acinetobacter baumannii]
MGVEVTVINQFTQFEWLAKGLTAQSLDFIRAGHSTGSKPIDFQDRLGAIAKMKTQLEKSITALIIFNGKSESDYD